MLGPQTVECIERWHSKSVIGSWQSDDPRTTFVKCHTLTFGFGVNKVLVCIMYPYIYIFPLFYIDQYAKTGELISHNMYKGFVSTKHLCTCLKKIWY